MKKWDILENIFIEKLIFWWKGLARSYSGKTIIVTWWVIPESIVNLRVIKIKSNYIETQLLDTVKKSPFEENLPSHFQVYGWCKWLPILYEKQLEIKEKQIIESFNSIKDYVINTKFHNIISSQNIYWYRNKVEFSWWKYISDKENIRDNFRFWFHKQAEFDRIINCTYCVLASDEINDIFKDVDKFSRQSGLSTYDQKTQIWFWRHLVVRKWFYTQEIMLIFSVNNLDSWFTPKAKKEILDFINELEKKYENIKSIYLLFNPWKADIVQWDYNLIFWKPIITEKLLNYNFEIWPKSFFQTNSFWAEILYKKVLDLVWKNTWVLLDIYAWTGTIWILLASRFDKVYSVEIVKEASEDGKKNAILNWVKNVEFINTSAEDFLKDYIKKIKQADVLIIDPPRDWINQKSLPDILEFQAKIIIYVSCNPATLVRDLDFIVKNSNYKIIDIIPVDMFPHTHHIETIVKLQVVS